MMDYINSHLAGFWILFGFVLLAAEVLLFGFTTIIFLFAGIAAVLTGLLMNTGVLTESWIAGIACFGLSTGLISTILWKPLKRLQDRAKPEQPPQSDFLGIEFNLEQNITSKQPGKHRYSGINWSVEIDTSAGDVEYNKGDSVKVVVAEVGVFKVIRLQ